MEAAVEGGGIGSVIEILVLKALAHKAQGESLSALESLERALTLAEPEGFVRTFVDEGSALAQLFVEAASRGIKKEYVKAGARTHGMELTDEQIQEITQLRQEYFLKVLKEESMPPFPGVLDLIEKAMQREDFRLAIATSGTHEKSQAVLEAAKIPYKKMVYIHGDHVKHKKPNPELFLLAAKGIDIEPANCVVIEDAPNGVQAAKTAGAKCIAVTNSTTADKLQQADLICESLTEVTLDTICSLITGG
jgi:HAD superfamily hydrolase (TIGR01509 family)